VCDAYILGIFDSLARWGPAPRCMPAGVTDKQALSIVTTYLSSHSEDLLLPADLLVVESGEVGFIALPPPARSNGSCSFPASRFPMWVALVGEGWVVFQGRGGSAALCRRSGEENRGYMKI
jgi:hypothetical protein